MQQRETERLVLVTRSLIVERRVAPNRAARMLVENNQGVTADDLQLALLETALFLEEMYDQTVRGEWNDWLRIDFWARVSTKAEDRSAGTTGLLITKTELYRAISLIAIDVIRIRRQGQQTVTGKDLLDFWRDNDSEYFRSESQKPISE